LVRTSAILFTILCAAGTLAQGIADTPGLEGKTTFWDRMTSVEAVLEKISRETGVRLRATPAAASTPVAIYARDVTAGSLLERLTALGLVWSQWEGNWTLGRSPAEEMRDRQFLERLAKSGERGLREAAAVWQAWAATPLADHLRQRAAIEVDMERLQREQRGEWAEGRAALGKRLAALPEPDDFPALLLGLLLAAEPGALKALASGKPLLATSSGGDWGYRLPRTAVDQHDTLVGAQETESVVLAAHWDPASSRLQVAVGAKRGENLDTYHLEQFTGDAVLSEGQPPSAQPTWSETPVKTAELPPPYTGGLRVATDYLSWYAESLGLPVIAEARRAPVHGKFGGESLAELHEFLASETLSAPSVEKGWLVFRPSIGISLTDPPAAMLRKLESRKEPPGLDDYAELASNLGPLQQHRFDFAQSLIAASFDTGPLRGSGPALRFWHSLSAVQKAKARSTHLLPYGEMSARQKALFEEAMLGKPVAAVKIMLRTFRADLAGEGLAFFIDDYSKRQVRATNGAIWISGDTEEAIRSSAEFAASTTPFRFEVIRSRQVEMRFGTGTDKSVDYMINLNSAWTEGR
jgi:hypothetical protein